MKVTVTGATRPDRHAARRARCAPAATRSPCSRATPRARGARRRGAVAWQPERRARARRRRCAGRDAVVHLAGENVAQRWNDDVQAPHPRLARARHAQPRGRDRGGRPAPARARLRLGRRLLRPARRRARSTEADPGRRRLPRRGLRRSGSARRAARPTIGLRVRHPPHRRRARRGRRRAGDDAAVLQARRRRPGRRRRAVHAVDPRRRRRRALRRGARRRRLGGPGQRERARAGHQQDVLQGARPRAAPPRRRAGAGPRGARSSTARWREIVTKGQRVDPRRAQELGYTFRTRTSTRRCARARRSRATC